MIKKKHCLQKVAVRSRKYTCKELPLVVPYITAVKIIAVLFAADHKYGKYENRIYDIYGCNNKLPNKKRLSANGC